MKPPILVFQSHDLLVYRSAQHAARHLEKVDVENGIYDAYDSNGLRLNLRLGQREIEERFLWVRWVRKQAEILVEESRPNLDCSVELHKRLVEFLKRKDTPAEALTALPLSELIVRAGTMMPWKMDAGMRDTSRERE